MNPNFRLQSDTIIINQKLGIQVWCTISTHIAQGENKTNELYGKCQYIGQKIDILKYQI